MKTAPHQRRLEWTWYAAHFLGEFILIYPTYALYMEDRGVSAFGLSILFVIWSTAAIVFEIPSGVLGDRFPRTRVVAAGFFVTALAFTCWLIFPTPIGFATGFVIWGLGGALRSGTTEALLHDALREQHRSVDFTKIHGRAKAAEGIGIVLALALGGYLAEISYPLPLALSALAPVAAGLLIGFLPEPAPDPSEEEEEANVLHGLRHLATHASMVPIVAVMVLGSAAWVLDEFDAPLLHTDANLALGPIGLATAGIWIARTIGVSQAHRLGPVTVSRTVLLFAFANLLLLPIALRSAAAIVVALAAYHLLTGVVEVLAQAALQANLSGENRATLTSVVGAGGAVWALGLFLGVGALGSTIGWASAFVAVGGVSFGAVLLIDAFGFRSTAPYRA